MKLQQNQQSYKCIFRYLLLMLPVSSIKTRVLHSCASSCPFSWKPPSDVQILDSLQFKKLHGSEKLTSKFWKSHKPVNHQENERDIESTALSGSKDQKCNAKTHISRHVTMLSQISVYSSLTLQENSILA